MEHIRRALEQAEKDRAEARSAVPSDTGLYRSVDNKGADSAPAPTATSADVRYLKTKIVDVSAETLERNRLVAALPAHELTDSYRMLRTKVLRELQTHGWNSIAITSPATGSGKTLTAINLAISLAREVNHTVLLVDLDLRAPSIHESFGYEPELGISDYLQHDAPIEEIMFSPGIDRLVVLPGRESIADSSETLRSPKMVSLVGELKHRYPDRIVICDLPPMLATDDALGFAPYTDAMLMVAEAGSTRREDLQQSLSILKDVRLIGTVLNKSEDAPSKLYGRK